MKVLFRFSLVCILLFCLASCAPEPPLSPSEYNQLLINIKEFFKTRLFLLGSSSNFQVGQAIARLYYGTYHIARLIYNNRGHDSKNHTATWNAMMPRIKAYGEQLKSLRIKYDYRPQNFDDNEIKQDLELIYNNKVEFENIIDELKKGISSFESDTDFLNTANKTIQDIENEYSLLINKIHKIGNNK